MWQYDLRSEDAETRVIDGYHVVYLASIERIKEENMILIGGKPVPFGGDAAWKRVKSQFRPGDELWFARSPDESWEAGMGVEGYVLVRDEKVIDGITTAFN